MRRLSLLEASIQPRTGGSQFGIEKRVATVTNGVRQVTNRIRRDIGRRRRGPDPLRRESTMLMDHDSPPTRDEFIVHGERLRLKLLHSSRPYALAEEPMRQMGSRPNSQFVGGRFPNSAPTPNS